MEKLKTTVFFTNNVYNRRILRVYEKENNKFYEYFFCNRQTSILFKLGLPFRKKNDMLNVLKYDMTRTEISHIKYNNSKNIYQVCKSQSINR